MLFQENQFDDIEDDSEASLRVLSNCVNLVNCTILRERKLLPVEYFTAFPVYGDVQGYMLNRNHPDAEEIARKMSSVDEAIRRKKIYKLGLLIEEYLNTNPIEAFIWNFTFDGKEASARMGHKKKKSAFRVNAGDMKQTCKSFCELFSDLQLILTTLLPLTSDLIPSLRAAYCEDPEDVAGFHVVQEFPNVSRIELQSVEFPHNHMFQLSYSSKFVANQAVEPSDVFTEQESTSDTIFSDEPQDSSGIEVTRRRLTLGYRNSEDRETDSSDRRKTMLQSNDSL